MAPLLVARGLLTPSQLQEALRLQRDTRKKLSLILAERRLLQLETWNGVLAQEVEEALYRPFRWTAGRYRFLSQASVDLPEGKINPLQAERLLLEGIRRVDEWPMIRQRVPSPAMVLKPNLQAGTFTPKQIEPNEVKMLDLVDGKRTVQELVDASGLGEFEATRSLAGLVEAGVISPVGPVPAPSGGPETPVALTLQVRGRPGPPPWLPRVAWGAAAAWLAVCAVFFGWEPSGLFPLSVRRVSSLNDVRALRARADLAQLVGALERYLATTGELPSSLEALGPLGRPLSDPWGHPYQIRRSAAGVTLLSPGPDGRVGTSDDLSLGED
jgi:hypothetical protein